MMRGTTGRLAATCAAFALLAGFAGAASGQPSWQFVEITSQAGFNYSHGFGPIATFDEILNSGGVAAGDYDGDGWTDLFVVRGDIGPNLLFRNLGNGSFSEVGAAAGVADTGRYCGPLFADYDGDGWLDLWVGSALGLPKLYHNNGDGTFSDVTAAAGLSNTVVQNYSAAFGDIDRDGDLDLVQSHWTKTVTQTANHVWRNEGDGTFTPVDAAVGISGYDQIDWSFTPNLADLNDDGWPDLLMTSDFETSRYFLNDGDGTFSEATTAVISDANGMGAAVGDYDNDGDLDWFASAILTPPAVPPTTLPTGQFSGNRLYCNQGGGNFADCTLQAGVLAGHWGWAATFQDFDNDGHLDLFHVNGYKPNVAQTPSVLFMSNGDGTFSEEAASRGIGRVMNGRGIAVFDFDRDGDLDVFIANFGEAPAFFENVGGNAAAWLEVELEGQSPNTEAIGARISLDTSTSTQMRELRAGNNYASQDPAVAHFGLGSATVVDELRVAWPSGASTVLTQVAVNQHLTLTDPGTQVPGPGPAAVVALAALICAGAYLRRSRTQSLGA